MQKSAVDFAQKFTDITGKLSLNHEEIIDMSDSIYNKTETTGYEYKGIKFYFTSPKSTTKLNLGDGTMCATENGINDKNYFTGKRPPRRQYPICRKLHNHGRN